MLNIIHGDCLTEMQKLESNSISAIVTDPPYGLKFMDEDWDHGIPGIPFWKEALRISKPGSFLLAFGGTRTFHRLTCSIEDAGWEIRDCIMWLYGSGFPKSHNHFGIEGFGTALKPSWEPILMAMKPCEGTFKQNTEKWGQAGINIDECRIETDEKLRSATNPNFRNGKFNTPYVGRDKEIYNPSAKGRWPANLILDEDVGQLLDEQKGGVSRFFYCTKASKSERNEGLEELEAASNMRVNALRSREEDKFNTKVKNNHPTVKPLKLMEYLIKLVMPPKEGILLDPFAGSGTTLLAAKNLGRDAMGIEKERDYVEIAQRRVEFVGTHK